MDRATPAPSSRSRAMACRSSCERRRADHVPGGRRTPRAPPRPPRSSRLRPPARSRPRPGRRRPSPRSAATPASMTPARQAAPAGVDHGHRPRPGQRHRQAVGDQHDRRHAARARWPGRRRAPGLAAARGLRADAARRRRAPGGPGRSARARSRPDRATRSRLAATHSGSSSVHRPRLRLAYGPVETPPRRVVNSARAPGRSISIASPLTRKGRRRSAARRRCSRDLQLEPGTGSRWAYSKCARPGAVSSSTKRSPLPHANLHRGGLAVVAVGPLAVGVVVGDAGEGLAVGLDVHRHPPVAVDRLEACQLVSPKRLGLRVHPQRAGGAKSRPPKRPTTGRAGPDLTAEAGHEHRHAVHVAVGRAAAVQPLEVVAVRPRPARGVLGSPQVRLAAALRAPASARARRRSRVPDTSTSGWGSRGRSAPRRLGAAPGARARRPAVAAPSTGPSAPPSSSPRMPASSSSAAADATARTARPAAAARLPGASTCARTPTVAADPWP